jgi:hypothetical protein
MYREGGENWDTYRNEVFQKILREMRVTEGGEDLGYWEQGFIGPIYTTAINLTILQLENGCLPIYQR